MKRLVLSFAFCLITATAAIAADTNPANVRPRPYVVEPAHTRVQFIVSNIGFTNWNSNFTGVSGSVTLDPKNVSATAVDISIPVASISNTDATTDAE